MLKPSINLLQAELLPEKTFFTLKNVVIIWCVSLLLMISLSGYSQWKAADLANQVAQLDRENSQYKKQSQALQTQLANHKADSGLLAELATLKSLAHNKRFLYSHLTNTDYSYIGGFAAAMTEFSDLHSKDISLEHIVIKQNELLFSGIARNPNAVPEWLEKFEHSKVLSGKLFQQFKMSEREKDNLVTFTVSSTNADLSGGSHAAVE
ncbi:PilN domain-containing protein [Thalassotalea sp. M1531]|uniref:PilN domain-containing protein n=1 Tax=Thalassotalea algicola TaxID=2716224 RepID=A0A7Y0Q7I4_9GAMM|nr:PilN domain-containing protein [Thalassotalea algicola]NMP31922.1 PilN domain-containing protein [Thalassotalea algicola]